MRLLARIGTWLKAASGRHPRPQETLGRGMHSTLAARLPRTPTDAFRARIKDALQEAQAREHVVLAALDPSIEALVIPRPEGLSRDGVQAERARDRRISTEIDQALAHLEGRDRSFSTVTWGALRDAHPTFSPPPPQWAGEHTDRLMGKDAGVVFFVDVEAIALAVAHAAEGLGLVARVDDDADTVRVGDGRFTAHVEVGPLIAEALWTGRGPSGVVAKRAAALPNELRGFVALHKGLERRFKGCRFDVVDDGLVARTAEGSAALDYRRLAAAQLQSGLGIDGWLARAQLVDLADDEGDATMLIRSPTYLGAYPDALARVKDNAAFVAVRLKDGGAATVRVLPGDHPARVDHYADEARRQLPSFRFEGHAFVVEQHAPAAPRDPSGEGRAAGDDAAPSLRSQQPTTPTRALCLVGDKAATVALHPTLLRGAAEDLLEIDERLRVVCTSENVVCLADPRAPEALVQESLRRAQQLEGDLFPDGSDALQVDREVALVKDAHGRFELSLVPQAYFTVRDEATARQDLGRGHSSYLRGLSFELLGKPELALPHFERAVRASSQDGEMNLALGRTLTAVGEHARAVTFLERAAAALPDHAEASNALGVALYRGGDHVHARAAFQRAVRLQPDEVGFLVNLGRACCDQRLYGEAKAALEHALRVEPSSAEAHATIAVLYQRTGERQRAMQHAREALSEHPDDETVKELLKMLEEEPS